MTSPKIKLLNNQRKEILAGRKRGPKYAMGLRYCHQLGTNYASHGIPLQRLIDELVRDGFKPNGLTVRRVTRAYNEQIARG